MAKPNFSQMLERAKYLLNKELKDKQPSDWVNEKASRGVDVYFYITVPINTNSGMYDFRFKIHSDTTCKAIQEFVNQVTLDNLTLAHGSRGGQRLGVQGVAIDGLNIYKAA